MQNRNKNNSKSEPNRAKRIKTHIKRYPSLFESLKLNMYDFRSKAGGDKKKIHDRYIITYNKDTINKGFHLSNSIQGATKHHPLLITPIPLDVLEKVNNYISNQIDLTKSSNEVDIVNLYNYKEKDEIKRPDKSDKILDKKLYQEICEQLSNEADITAKKINILINRDSNKVFNSFKIFWSTFGHFLANIGFPDKILSIVKEEINPDVLINLRKYLEITISHEYPIGFNKEKDIRGNSFIFLFENDFENRIKDYLQIENYIHESGCYRNWGVFYGCNLLVQADFNEYIQLIEFLQNNYNSINKNADLMHSPLYKLISIVFNILAIEHYWHDNKDIILKGLESDNELIKSISCAALISLTLDEKSTLEFEESKELLINNLTIDQSLVSFIFFLFNSNFKNKNDNLIIEEKILNVIAEQIVNNFTKERLDKIFEKLLKSNYPLIEKKITESIFHKLIESKNIDTNTIFQFWSNEFIKVLNVAKSYEDYAGRLDIAGWSLCVSNKKDRKKFVKYLKKEFDNNCREIWKPLSKGTTSWTNAYERILLIRTVLAIALLYNQDNESKIEEDVEIQEFIEQIETLEKDYNYNVPFNKIQELSVYISDIYHNKYKKI